MFYGLRHQPFTDRTAVFQGFFTVIAISKNYVLRLLRCYCFRYVFLGFHFSKLYANERFYGFLLDRKKVQNNSKKYKKPENRNEP